MHAAHCSTFGIAKFPDNNLNSLASNVLHNSTSTISVSERSDAVCNWIHSETRVNPSAFYIRHTEFCYTRCVTLKYANF